MTNKKVDFSSSDDIELQPTDFEEFIRERIDDTEQILTDIEDFKGNKRDRRNILIGSINAYYDVLDEYHRQ